MYKVATPLHVLVIEDNKGDFVLIKDHLQEEFTGLTIKHATTFLSAKKMLEEENTFHIILLDLSLPDASGELLVTEIVQAAGTVPVIVLTGYANKNFGIKTLSLGVYDYLLKDDLDPIQLSKSIAYSIERMNIGHELKSSEEKYRNLFNLSPSPMLVFNPETLCVLNVNNAAITHYGFTHKEFLSKTLKDIVPPGNNFTLADASEYVSKRSLIQNGIYQHQKKNGDIIDVNVQYSDIHFNGVKAMVALSNDITQETYQKNILAFEKEVYELNATTGKSFRDVVSRLTQNIERLIPNSYCSISQIDDSGCLFNLTTGSVPIEYLDTIEGLKISSEAGSCGTAMFTGKNVFVDDIGTSFLWKKYLQFIGPFGFKACWSVPIKKGDGKIIGSIAMYFKSIKAPLANQVNLMERAASLAGVLIENRTAEESIRKSNDRYDIVAKATSDVIWDWDLLHDSIMWNKGLNGILGYEEDNNTTYADWWSSKLHPDDRKRVMDNISLHIQNKIIKWQDEYRFLCGDGSYCYIFDRGFLLTDEENVPVRMIGAMQDITKQKKEEHRLKLLESVITNASDAVMITDAATSGTPGNNIIYINDAFTKMTGYQPEELIGQNPDILQGERTSLTEQKRLKKAIKHFKSCEAELINYKKNGEEFWVNIAISPVADSNGIYTHWIAIERDVTARKKEDQEITKAIINAQEQERFQIGSELHDNVNQILAGVLLSLGMTRGKPAEVQKEWVDKSVGYVNMAINEIRKLSHRLAPASFDDSSLESTFEALLESINVDHQYQFILCMDDTSNLSLDGDIQLNLYRILQEQLNNIIKYAQATAIEVSLRTTPNLLTLRIFDNGVGFDKKIVKTGIGISNIRKRTDLFSGHFSLHTAPGKGCEVIVEIPLQHY